MKKRNIILLILLGIVFLVYLFLIVFNNSYNTFSWDGARCITYEKECNCIGMLATLESYPPQYKCTGLNFCRNVNRTVCE